jgi:hypothetical protein
VLGAPPADDEPNPNALPSSEPVCVTEPIGESMSVVPPLVISVVSPPAGVEVIVSFEPTGSDEVVVSVNSVVSVVVVVVTVSTVVVGGAGASIGATVSFAGGAIAVSDAGAMAAVAVGALGWIVSD